MGAKDPSFILGSPEGLKCSSWLRKWALEASLWETIESLKDAGSVFSDMGEQPQNHRQPAWLSHTACLALPSPLTFQVRSVFIFEIQVHSQEKGENSDTHLFNESCFWKRN